VALSVHLPCRAEASRKPRPLQGLRVEISGCSLPQRRQNGMNHCTERILKSLSLQLGQTARADGKSKWRARAMPMTRL